MAHRRIDGLRHFVAIVLVWLALMPAHLVSAHAGFDAFEPLTILSGSDRHEFQVEVMRTPAEQERGMMFRRELAADKGMLFDLGSTREASFWMQNTYVSLDMLFILPNGRIHRIERATEPLSTAVISSGAPVAAVLEVVAGTSDRLGLKAGDLIIHPMFAP